MTFVTIMRNMPIKKPNTWTPKQAAEWAGIPYRLLLEFLAEGLLPAIPVGPPKTQAMPGGKKRNRRVAKWIIPREAFIRAWQNFTVREPRPRRKRNAA